MKKNIQFIFSIASSLALNAQVGINTELPRATLEIKKSNKKQFNEGIIIPITTKEDLSKLEAEQLVKPTLVYVEGTTTSSSTLQLEEVTQEGFYFYNGKKWKNLLGEEVDVDKVVLKLYPKIEDRYFKNMSNSDGKLKIGTNTGGIANGALEVSADTTYPLVVNSRNYNGGGIALYTNSFNNRTELGVSPNNDFFIKKGAMDTHLWISNNGNVGIGTSNATQKLEVDGAVRATAFYGTNPNSIFPDYVFQHYYTGKSVLNPQYEFKDLAQVESFIKEKGHLPNYPSAKEVAEKGYTDLSKIQLTNVEKIEELYLHSIDQAKQIEVLKKQVAQQAKALEILQRSLEALQAKVSDK